MTSPARMGKDVSRHNGLLARCTDEADNVVVVLSGELDAASRAFVTRLLEEEALDGHGDLVLDMAGVTFVDSSGLAVVVAASRLAAQHGNHVVVRQPSGQFRRLLDLTGVDEMVVLDPP